MTGIDLNADQLLSKLPHVCRYEDCEAPREGSTDFCARHGHAMRKLAKDLKRQKEKRFVPISKMSQKRAGEMADYLPLKEEWIKANPLCLVKMEGCTKFTTEPHHRSSSADDFLVVETWLACCRSCHTKLEALPAEVRREMLYLIEPTKKSTI